MNRTQLNTNRLLEPWEEAQAEIDKFLHNPHHGKGANLASSVFEMLGGDTCAVDSLLEYEIMTYGLADDLKKINVGGKFDRTLDMLSKMEKFFIDVQSNTGVIAELENVVVDNSHDDEYNLLIVEKYKALQLLEKCQFNIDNQSDKIVKSREAYLREKAA